MPQSRPKLAIISETLRRDLQDPLKYFKRVEILHFYRDSGYKDMRDEDFAAKPIQYRDAAHLSQLLDEHRPDIIQGPEPYASRKALANAWTVYRYAQRTGTPYIFPMFENRPAAIKFGPFVGWWMEQLLGIYGRAAAGVIYLNAGAKRSLRSAGVPATKLTKLNWGTWGIDTAEFKPAPTKRSKRPIVFFVGRISDRKGLPDLLNAWPSILEAVPTAKLVIGGPTIDEEGAALVERMTSMAATTYVGPIKNAELPRFFQEAWVTVAPSVTITIWEEQVGMVLLQSLACATPVVSTTSGAIPEYVGDGHGATLVEEHDSAGLARATITYLTDAKRREADGARGVAHVVKHYEVQANVALDEQYVLDRLASARRVA